MKTSRQSARAVYAAVLTTAAFVSSRVVVAGEEPAVRPPASARQILREASRIAALQPEHQDYWRDRTLLLIGSAQIRGYDFDGALQSIRKSTYDYGRNAAFVELAEAMAAFGDLDGALGTIRVLGSRHGWSQQLIDDGVRLRWIDYLISVKDFERAQKVIDQVQDRETQSRAICQLGVGLFTAGKKALSDESFRRAIEAAGRIDDDYGPGRALCEIADAQMGLNESESAAKTIREALKRTEQLKPGWTKMYGFRESAIRAAKNNDRATAVRLFSQSVNLQAVLDEENRANALDSIAVAQANVGFIDNAIETARLIAHSDKDFTRDGRREEALCQIAIAQAKAGKFEDAILTATSIEHYIQYQNDSLMAIVHLQIARGNLEAALATAAKMENASTKAAAALVIATAAAKSGDAKKARSIAARIKLKQVDRPLIVKPLEFDFSRTETWGELYDEGPFFTGLSHSFWVKRAAELADAAMALKQALKEDNAHFEVAFKDMLNEEVILALARAHAANGNPQAAFAWASRIGSDRKIISEDDSESRLDVQRRIHALVGVAEGMLDKSDGAKAEFRRRPSEH
jgi:tetratricopeptide (TPR) repeat protein